MAASNGDLEPKLTYGRDLKIDFGVPGSGFGVPGRGFGVPGRGFGVPGRGFGVPGGQIGCLPTILFKSAKLGFWIGYWAIKYKLFPKKGVFFV